MLTRPDPNTARPSLTCATGSRGRRAAECSLPPAMVSNGGPRGRAACVGLAQALRRTYVG